MSDLKPGERESNESRASFVKLCALTFLIAPGSSILEDPVFQWAGKKHPAQCLKRTSPAKALSANYNKEAI
jgi:hypothetical protein